MAVSPCHQGHVLHKNREGRGERKRYEISEENLKNESLLVIDVGKVDANEGKINRPTK